MYSLYFKFKSGKYPHYQYLKKTKALRKGRLNIFWVVKYYQVKYFYNAICFSSISLRKLSSA